MRQPHNFLSVFDHFVGWALKRLNSNHIYFPLQLSSNRVANTQKHCYRMPLHCYVCGCDSRDVNFYSRKKIINADASKNLKSPSGNSSDSISASDSSI